MSTKTLPAKLQPTTATLITAGSFTIPEWCQFRKIPRPAFYEMQRRGVGPKVTAPPGAPPRITVEADAAWVKFCENLPPKIAAEAEKLAEGRRERARKAATKAVASPTHVSKTRRADYRALQRQG
jgi:hypothetical protein